MPDTQEVQEMSNAFTDEARKTERALEQFRKNNIKQQPHPLVNALRRAINDRSFVDSDGDVHYCPALTVGEIETVIDEWEKTQHIPAPKDIGLLSCDKCKKILAQGTEDAARAATLAALALLEEWDYHNNRNFLKPHPTFHEMIHIVRERPKEARKHVESLRKEYDQG